MTNVDYVDYNKEKDTVTINYKGCGCCASSDTYSKASATDELKEYMDDLLDDLLEVANILQIPLDTFIASKVKQDDSEG